MSDFTVELCCCTNTLLQEIGNKAMKRADVAMTYALAMQSSEETDWLAVNMAIINRWSPAGLEWIKKEAHKQNKEIKNG